MPPLKALASFCTCGVAFCITLRTTNLLLVHYAVFARLGISILLAKRFNCGVSLFLHFPASLVACTPILPTGHLEARVGAPGDEAGVPSRKGGFGREGNITLKDREDGEGWRTWRKRLSLSFSTRRPNQLCPSSYTSNSYSAQSSAPATEGIEYRPRSCASCSCGFRGDEWSLCPGQCHSMWFLTKAH